MSAVYHILANNPFSQNWTDTGLITVNDNWDSVSSIIGYRGDDLTVAIGADPQILLADGLSTPVNAIANQTNPNTLTTGGIAEFEIADPVVAFQGSATADAPFLVLYLNTSGVQNVNVSYLLRDVDGSIDNAIQPVALQYRVGTTGNFINIPGGFVADASSGPSLATLTTQVNAVLPADANNQAQVQLRIITANALGSDEWIGIDNINVSGSAIAASVANPNLTINTAKFIGQAIFATGFIPTGAAGTVNGVQVPVGGLSGVTYDAANNRYYAISDDRSQVAPARFYTFTIDPATSAVTFTNVTTIKDPNSNTFALNTIDTEGIALTKNGTVFISSEGEVRPDLGASRVTAPFIKEFNLATGVEVRSLPVPAKFLSTIQDTNNNGVVDNGDIATAGVRNNLAFESLTITPDQTTLFTASENALTQDGAATSTSAGTRSRILQYNLTTGQPEKEYLYTTDAAPVPNPVTGAADNGLVDLLAIDNRGTLLALERSFAVGVGNSIKLFEVTVVGATDITSTNSLSSLTAEQFNAIQPARKRLLLNLNDLNLPNSDGNHPTGLDNIEGLAFGAPLADGRQSIVLVSDNNFGATQFTQILTLGAIVQPSIQITEYEYAGTNGEFIEFTNIGFAPVDLTGWSYDDNSRLAGSLSLSAFGTVQPNESVILTEADAATFRTAWNIPATVKIIGGSTQNLGRADEINIYDASGLLVDRLTYDDQTIPNTIRAQNVSGSTILSNLSATTINPDWRLAAVGDAQNSRTSTGGDIGSPGTYNTGITPPTGIPTVNLSVSANSGSEANATAVIVTATATSAVSGNQTVALGVTGTGITTGDFTLSSSTILIPTGQTTGSVTFMVVDDVLAEGNETATLTISNPSAGIAIATATQNVDITDNDAAPANLANLVTTVVIAGGAPDLTPLNGGTGSANTNRLGGFGSDFFYDYRQNLYYGVADRGPGGGVIDYQTRVQQFSIDINPTTGAINSYQLLKTIPFTIPAGTTLNGVTYATTTPFNGLNARLLNGDAAILGASQDPEGFVVGRNGNFFVSDEYGPSIYEFSPTGSFIRAFSQPSNVIPRVNGANYFAGDITSTTGRQDNRGYEGLAISPDGTKLFAIFQDALQEEGSPTGRNSRNDRIVRFDVATGQSEAQFIYQLEAIADINARIPGTANDFAATAQGRNIGVSSLTAISNTEFLVLERDNRGLGVTDPLGNTVVGSKQIFRINLAGATDVSGISLSGTNTLPSNVTPVSKSLFLDIAGAIQGVGQKIPEKIEGVAVGPQLSDGTFALVIATDNDFSVTQNASNTQFDVYANGVSFRDDIPIGSPAPTAPNGEPAYALLPSDIYGFKTQAAALNPTPLFDFNVAGFSVIEGNAATTNATVRVTRRGSLANTDTVQLQLANGTATATSDFNNAAITVTFAPNETFKDVVIPVVGDRIFEPDETVNLSLANPSSGTVLGSRQPNATLTIQNDDAFTPIHDIQGARQRSPLEGQIVATQGIVTAIATNGFYLQDPNPDNNPATSEAIFVFTSSAPAALVTVGASLNVSGTVSEFRPGNNPENLTTTQIGGTTANPLAITAIASLGSITPTIIGIGGRTIPTQNIQTTPVLQTLQNVSGLALLSEIQEPNITPNTAATGNFTYRFNGNQVTIAGSYSGLTSDRTAINLNVGAARTLGTLVGDLTVTGTTGANTNFTGTFTLNAAQLTEFQAGRAFVNISSANFPVGELRGQLGPSIELSAAFDPTTSGLDFFESLEGMLVQINNPVAVSPTNDFGEIFVLADNGAGATGRTPRGGIIVTPGDFNPERIQIDDDLAGIGTNPNISVGGTLSTVQGVISYNFNNYEVLVTALPTVLSNPLTREVTPLVGTANQLTIGAFNVENLDPSDTLFGALSNQIVNNLKSPDILSIEEIQDNNGATNNGIVDAMTTYNLLIGAIAAAGGPTYQFRQIDPVNNQDGGEPGGNIRVGFLFNAARVSFVDRAGGTSTNNTTIVSNNGKAEPTFSPGRLQDNNLADGAAFNSSRKPLVGEFIFNGQQVIVVGNHLNSKGGDQPLSGPTQPAVQFSETQRIQQAQIINDFVDSVLAVNPNANIVVLGDINDFDFSEPTNVLRGVPNGVGTPVLTTLLSTLPANERYTYNFQGNAQVLDQILASNALISKLDGFDVLNINSEFSDQVSDHDPSVARFNLPANNAPVVANAIADQATKQGSAFNFTLAANTFTDSDAGDSLKFVATLENGNALPTWLTFNPTTRIFSGTPAVGDVGTFNVRVVATDNFGANVNDVFALTVATANNAPIVPKAIAITEYSYSAVNGEFVEFTNTGLTAVDFTGWSFDDNTRTAGSVSLSSFGVVKAGESVIVTETVDVNAFRAAWGIPNTVKVIGGSGTQAGLQRGDEINLYDQNNQLIDRLTFDDAAIAGSVRAQNVSATTTPVNLRLNDISRWRLSTVGDVQGSITSTGGDIGSPGRYTPLAGIDLSTYTRVGRFNLPEPTRTSPPTNSLLAQEVSAVTYNADTDTLFVAGDGSTSIVQVSKTGQLIDSMTLALGNSPQGTDFFDIEGLTYVGDGKFVLIEERDRQANLFTYIPNTTLTRSQVQTVKLGTTIGNIGIEGISFDPQTNGFIAVKETQPEGIFQTTIDFGARTASNGSPTTVNSTNLFDPALAGLADFADVYALSNLYALSGKPDSSRLLLLSQESGRFVNIDRTGKVFSSFTIASDPGNPLSVVDQQYEGITVDNDGFIYVTSENGGGSVDFPQLTVYAPSTIPLVPNLAPTAVVLSNQINAIAENTSTANPIKVADIAITDDGLGTNTLSLSGTDAGTFEITGNALFIRTGTNLDFETRTSYSVTVNVDDTTVGNTPDATSVFNLAVTDIVNETPPLPTTGSIFVTEVAPWSSGNSPVAADWFELTNTSTSAIDITGWKIDDNSNSFGSSVPLSGITRIGAGESVIFIEGATINTIFLSNWFGTRPPANLQIGNYSGSGVGLSTAGDAVNIYNSTGVLQANIVFGVSPAASPFATFDNAALANNATIATASVVGINGAFSILDSLGNTEIGSPGTIRNPNAAPIVANAIADQTAPEDSAFSFTLAANAFSDVDAGDSLRFTATLENGNALPTWLSFNATTRTFSGTPANADVSTFNVRVVATDNAGASVSDVFALIVVNTNDAPVVTNAIADQTAPEDSAFSFTLAANAFSDVDAGDSLKFAATLENGNALPTWLTFNATTRTFSGTPTNGDVSTFNVRVVATDNAGANVSDVFALTVLNTNDAPVVANAIADQAATQGSAFSFQVAANAFTDVDAGDVLTLSATRADGSALPTWLTFNPTTRTFSGTPAGGDVGILNVKVTASDRANAKVSDNFEIRTASLINANNGIITTTPGNDVLVAAVGTAFNGQGNIVFTGAGDDTVDLLPVANSRGNRIYLGSNQDIIFANGGDRLFGGSEDDIFEASEGKGGNRMYGGAGNDTFFLGSKDFAFGGDGNDRIFAGVGGANTFVGGAGNDQFWIVNGELPELSNTILDFTIGSDVIGLSGAASLGINAANLTINQLGANTAIGFNGQTLAILNGIQASSLSAANPAQFVFA